MLGSLLVARGRHDHDAASADAPLGSHVRSHVSRETRDERGRERSLEVAEAHLHDAQPRLLPLVWRLGGRLEDPTGLEGWGWAYVPGLVLG